MIVSTGSRKSFSQDFTVAVMPSGVTAMLFAFLELHRVTLKEAVLWDSSCL